jgi:dipeptidyl-peptidase-4
MKKSVLVLCSIFLLTNLGLGQKELTLESIWKPGSPFSQKSVSAVRSMNDGLRYTAFDFQKSGLEIGIYSYASREKIGTLIKEVDLKLEGMKESLKLSGYSFNSDETKMLLETDVQAIYRRSYTAQFYVYDIKTKALEKLSDNSSAQQLAEFSPDGNKVAYLMDNNIYYKDFTTGKTVQVTNDGEKNKIINGSTDWVYEEEFAIVKAFYWNADGTKLAYLKFDETEVPEFQMEYYGDLYPEIYKFKYPKAGEKNSDIGLFIYDYDKKTTTAIESQFVDDNSYIPRINWTKNPNELLVQRLNRHQNHLRYFKIKYDNSTGPQFQKYKEELVYEETSDTYIEIDDNLIFTEDGKYFIRTSEQNGYMHIYKIGFDKSIQQITKGEWDVIEFKGLNAKNGLIYYTSAEEGAIYKSLYVIGLNGKKKKKLSTKKGQNDAVFSTGMKYYINYHTDSNTPMYVTLHEANGKELKVLEDNAALKKELAQYDLSRKEFFKIQGAEGELNAWMIKPPNFDPNKKYPVYMNVYCGPGHNTVLDSYDGTSYLWHQLLAKKGYIVVSVDPRGTMYRGQDFKKSTYLQLGKLETEDMIASAKWLGKQSYVDKGRIGIQGWSYGGYMSSLCMTKGADFFKMGIAVAPVTNWRFYDSIYTERFMRTPQENAAGYDDNSPINHVEKLKGSYLLVHGSADDNVHHQNTMEMVTALVNADKQFDLFIYPNKNHGIYGGNTRYHLFNKMLNFTLEKL